MKVAGQFASMLAHAVSLISALVMGQAAQAGENGKINLK